MWYTMQLVALICLTLPGRIYATSPVVKSYQRIIGGTEAFVSQFPFSAAIHVQTDNGRYFCGGTLIGQKWILTAGHCIYNATLFSIQLGSVKLTESDPNRIILSSSEYILHPDFNSITTENDIGVIVLRMPITYNNYIQPINITMYEPANYTTVTVFGWGQTSDTKPDLSEVLRTTQVRIIPNHECKLVYGDQIFDNMVCAEGNYNEGTCTGDNGSGVVEYLGRYNWLVGVSSFVSANGCESTDPSGYTRVHPYAQWIRSIIDTSF